MGVADMHKIIDIIYFMYLGLAGIAYIRFRFN